MSQGFVPENIAKNTKWAINVFSSWLESQNHRPGESTPMDYLDGPFSTEASKVELARILSLFLVEAKKHDGNPYPAKKFLSIELTLACCVGEISIKIFSQ